MTQQTYNYCKMEHNKINEAGYNEAPQFGPSENNPPMEMFHKKYDLKNTTTKPMENKYEVRFRDIDPDTGDVSQDKLIAVCETKNLAQWVLQAFERADQGEEPNREFYIKTN